MAPTRIATRQIRLGPEVPLGRQGCLVESSLSHETSSGWHDTYFKHAADERQLPHVIDLLRRRGEEVFTVLKSLVHDPNRSFNASQLQTLEELLNLGVVRRDSVNNNVSLTHASGNWGASLECATLIALEDLHIQALREVKVKYPYAPPSDYDPDGQKYDVLAGLDWSRLLWIECKKPLYLPGCENRLASIVSKDLIGKFYRRALLLRPTIAVFLVDTLEDYREALHALFTADFLESGCVIEPNQIANQLIARLHGFMYFVRVKYKSFQDYVPAIRESLSQVLHDARNDWIFIEFSGEPFK